MNEFEKKIDNFLSDLSLEQLIKLHFRLWGKDLNKNFEEDWRYRGNLIFKIKEELFRVLV